MLEKIEEQLLDLTSIEVQKKMLKDQLEELEEREKSLKDVVMEEMKVNQLKNYENEKIKITYVSGTERVSIDSEKLKREYPEAYDVCKKITNVKENMRISVKGE